MHGARQPAIVINGAVAEDFEILRGVPALHRRVGEGVGHADALDRSLGRAVDTLGLGQTCSLQDGWSDIDNVMPLGPYFTLRGDLLGPMHHHPVAGSAIA